MRFRTTVELGGRTATGIRVPDDVVGALNAGRRPAVRVTINGHTYRSTIAARGGEYLLPVSAENREAAGVEAGDEVDVEVELDDQPRSVAVPDDFAAALATEAVARSFFEGLSYSQQRWFVSGIEAAKKPETRARRVEAAVTRLREGRGQR